MIPAPVGTKILTALVGNNGTELGRKALIVVPPSTFCISAADISAKLFVLMFTILKLFQKQVFNFFISVQNKHSIIQNLKFVNIFDIYISRIRDIAQISDTSLICSNLFP